MTDAGGFMAVLGVLEPIAIKVYDYLEISQKKKETKEKIYLGLQNEILNYQKYIDEIVSIIDEKYIPRLENLNEEYTKMQINSLLLINSNLIGKFGNLINSQVDFAVGCKNISYISGLMNDLQSADKVVYEFIMLSKEIVLPNNKMIFDQKLYRFFLSYQNEIFNEVNDSDVENISNDMMSYINKIKNIVKPAVNKGITTRDVKRDYIKNIKYFIKAEKRIKIDNSIVKNMNAYVPNKLKPLIPVFEEIKKIVDEEQKRQKLIQRRNERLKLKKYGR